LQKSTYPEYIWNALFWRLINFSKENDVVDRAGFETIWVQSVEKSRLSGGNTDKGAEILLMQGGQSK
jgi:hypothetical protein